MLWFRAGEQIAVALTFVFTIGMLGSIIQMMSQGASRKSMASDPLYNGTLTMYIIIIIIQLAMFSSCIFGAFIAIKVWKNNYQMDRQIRHWFTSWLSSWCASLLANLSIAIWALVKGREPQDELSYLFDTFTRMSTDGTFIASFEKYQRENSCCGVYGPDDWLMIQLRPSGHNSGAGGGFQTLDDGFRANPSTGKCHLTPPTIPMGCGKKILEEIRIKLSTFAGLMIVETFIGVVAGILAWYCFFYWLEKEVLVIPEDEVSNLIIIEPESSTSTVVDNTYLGSGGYLPPGGPYSARYIPPQYGQSRMGRNSYLSSRGYDGGGHGTAYHDPYYSRSHNIRHGETHHHHPSGSHYAPKKSDIQVKSRSKLHSGTVQNHDPPEQSPFGNSDSENRTKNSTKGKNSKGNHSHPSVSNNENSSSRDSSRRRDKNILSATDAYDANSRFNTRNLSVHSTVRRSHYPLSIIGSVGHRTSVVSPPYHARFQQQEPPKKHSFNHMLHKQEAALGGKVLGEMRMDHSKDPDPMNPNADAAKGEKGHRDHHATLAIVRNKKPPEPQAILNKKPGGHHGQTGHLAEDIAEMSGKNAKDLIDDVVLPVEHNPPPVMGRGGYLATHKPPANHRTGEERKDDKTFGGAAHLEKGGKISAPSVAGSLAQNIVETIINPVAIIKLKEPQNIKPHRAGVTPVTLHHDHRYLPTDNHTQHHYLPSGNHQGTHYLAPGEHEHIVYHDHVHTHDHYLPAEHHGEHAHTHYIQEHHIERTRTHYLHEHHVGEQNHGHYLPDHQSRRDAETHVLYKNPVPMDYTD